MSCNEHYHPSMLLLDSEQGPKVSVTVFVDLYVIFDGSDSIGDLRCVLSTAFYQHATYTDKKGRADERLSGPNQLLPSCTHMDYPVSIWSLDNPRRQAFRKDRIPQTEDHGLLINSHLRWHCLGRFYTTIPLESRPSAGQPVTACQIEGDSDPKIQIGGQ